MAQYRRYTKAEKAKVVAIAEMKGQTAAAEQTGVPLSTVHAWFERPEYAGLRTKTREDVAEQFWVGIQIALKAVVNGIEDGKLSEKAIAFGVLYDKYALMTGGATGRTESRDLSSRSDHERAVLSDVIDAELSRRLTDPSPAEDGAGTGEAGLVPEVSG